MHEASLMRALVSKVEELAAIERASRVTGLHVRLGALSHMSPGHFREHFEESFKGTIAEGATLRIETSDDIAAPFAQTVLIESIDVED